MKRFTLAAITALLGVGLFLSFWQDAIGSAPDDDVKAFMQIKLKNSQELLAGLALEDYDKIAKHAQKLSLLSLESNWKILQTREYIDQSKAFRDATDRMGKEAKKKNLDGATLAYVEMTFRCVHCHKYVRSQ